MRPRAGPIDRRRAIALAAGATSLACAPAWAAQGPDPEVAAVEAKVGGRLGFMALDTATGRQIAYKANERFATASTFKWLLVAAVLARVDRGIDHLDRWIPYGKAQLLAYAPVTTANLAKGGMELGDLCAAAIELSDNTAANLLLESVGGPAGLTRWLRLEGDQTTLMVRNEPSLNSAIAGDPRDTTSPAAMVRDLNRFLMTPALQPDSSERLVNWLVGCKTGDAQLRAGLPKGWRVGDKTGSGANGTNNDVAITWPPSGRPILIAAYLTGGKAPEAARHAALAELGRLVGTRFGAA